MRYNTHEEKRKAEFILPALHRWLRAVIDYLACAYMILVLLALPLYFRDGYAYIASRKSGLFSKCTISMAEALAPVMLLYGIVSVALRCRADKALSHEKSREKLWIKIRDIISAISIASAVDFFAAWYGVAVVASFLCTEYREDALWGANGWYMGFYTQMVMVCSYFLISRFWKGRNAFFYMILPVSAAVFLLGYLNRFGIYPIEIELASASFISTIGNINWYCGYVATVFFGGVSLLWLRDGQKSKSRAMLIPYVFLGFATLVTQGSASGVLTLIVMLLVMLCLSVGDGNRMLAFGMIWLLLSVACLFTSLLRAMAPDLLNYQDDCVNLFTSGALPTIMTLASCAFTGWIWLSVRKGAYRRKSFQILARTIVTVVSCAAATVAAMVALNTFYPGSIGKLSEYEFFSFSDTWASSRGATWKCGVRTFIEQDTAHKLTGVGPDAMAAYIYNDGSEGLLGMVRENFGTVRLTNAHNEWLTILADTGILGLIGFGGMMATAIGTLLGKGSRNPLACACGFCLLAYTINNIFSFQQVVNTPTAFVLSGMGMAFCREKIYGKEFV